MTEITKLIYRGSKQHMRKMAVEELVEMVKSEEVALMVSKFRRQWRDARMMGRADLRRRLPHILFGGGFTKRGMAEYSGYVVLELHNLKSREEQERIREELAACPNVLLAMEGAIERSMVFVVPYTRPDGTVPQRTKEMRMFLAHAYRHAVKTFEPLIAAAITLEEPVVEKSVLLGCDPDVYFNADARPVIIEQPVEMPQETVYQEHYEKMQSAADGGPSDFDHHRFCAMQYDHALADAIRNCGDSLDKGDFKPLLVHTARQCFKSGIEEEECVSWNLLYIGNFISELEIRATIANIYAIEKGFGDTPLYNHPQAQAMALEEFMNRRYELRFNMMTHCPECRERSSFCFEFTPVDERKLNSIVLNAKAEGLNPWDRDVHRFVHSDRVPNYRPVEEYLKRLPKWDGKDRIRPLMNRVTSSNPRWTSFSYCWFLSMVAHWQGRDTEHANALSPLLVGGQGFGKSTFCKSLLPPELQIYYNDTIDFGKKRDAELALTRFALINLDEFDQANERHQAFLKYLIQTPVVTTRKPYGSQMETMKRYASFIGTSNHTDLLNDLSGSRRFLCIEVKQPIDTSQPIEYDQLYAQAIAALDSGENYWLDHESEQLLMEDNERFRQRSLAEDLFYRYYRPAEHDEEGTLMTAGEIYEQLQLKSGARLPQSKKYHFGRFLTKAVSITGIDRRGNLYKVVELV